MAGNQDDSGQRGISYGFASARRRAIRQVMHPTTVKHGLLHSPTIKHTQNGTGTQPPKFGVGGGFKSGGF